MQYISTRNRGLKVAAAEAIVSGLAPDGGLFLPETIPSIPLEEITGLAGLDYPARAARVLGWFLEDFTAEELAGFTTRAYSRAKFAQEGTAPVVRIDDTMHILELFHGPTCAFKDFALQLLPYLLTASLKKTGVDKTVIILVATSGDTGKAALEGFTDVPGTKICVFYPQGGTSSMQRRQMVTQEGANVMVAAVKGNFDDAQNGVKSIFSNDAYARELAGRGFILSSANSINWGRLAPQIAYYFSAYCDLLNSGAVKLGDKINITVPTGNFGNILAAYLAKCCGLPIARLICASNRNKVLTDFIASGVYNCNRPFYLTSSPSMDILVSSNLERLLFLLCGMDDAQLRGYMAELKTTGRYQVSGEILARLQSEFAGGFANDAATAAAIRETFDQSGYLVDTHTAVGIRVYQDYRRESGDGTPTVVAATASPFKFCGSVLPALGYDTGGDDFALLSKLERISGRPAPARLAELKTKPDRFTGAVDTAQMQDAINSLL